MVKLLICVCVKYSFTLKKIYHMCTNDIYVKKMCTFNIYERSIS